MHTALVTFAVANVINAVCILLVTLCILGVVDGKLSLLLLSKSNERARMKRNV